MKHLLEIEELHPQVWATIEKKKGRWVVNIYRLHETGGIGWNLTVHAAIRPEAVWTARRMTKSLLKVEQRERL